MKNDKDNKKKKPKDDNRNGVPPIKITKAT
jgi:hypothetical protein